MDSHPPILAIAFGSPLLLWGLALGAIPIVIHLLNRRRYRETNWAAMQFVMAAVKKNSRRMRIEQLLLLAVRTLLVVLLVLALAEPFAAGLASAVGDRPPVHRVIVVDASYSMATVDGNGTRFERARRMARELAAEARDGDALNLVVVRDGSPRVVVREPSFRSDVVVNEIDGLGVTDEAGDLAGTLEEVAELLQAEGTPGVREVVVLSDVRRRDWQPVEPAGAERLETAIRSITDQATLRVVDASRSDVPNVRIVDFVLEEPYVTLGTPIGLRAELVADTEIGSAGLTVECLVDGRLADTRTVRPSPGDVVPVGFTITPDAPGEHVIEVRVAGDGLDVDNRRWVTVDVRESVDVLLVDGRPSGRPMRSATDFLKLALEPDEGEGAFIRQRVVTEGELSGIDLSRYDGVFLCNVGLITQREATILRNYVESGGGLVIALGDHVQTASYNELLYADDRGLLPAEIVDRRITAPDGEGFEIAADDLSHPLVRVFDGNPNSGLATTRVYAYGVCRLGPETTSRVALRFANGDPAILEKPFGAGRCVLVTTSLDRGWGGPWPGWPSFPQLMREIVAFGVSTAEASRLVVGQPFSRAYPAGAVGATAAISGPNGFSESVELVPREQLAQLVVSNTEAAGPYRVEIGPPLGATVSFAVNVDSDEGRLTPLAATATGSPAFADVVFANEIATAPETSTEAGAVANPLRRWLLTAVFCLLIVESLMAWRFGYGFALLCVLVAVPLGWRAFGAASITTTVLTAVIAAGAAFWWIRRSRGSRSPSPGF